MLQLLLVLLASPASSTNVDAQAAFKRYCDDFCGSGGVANCDIGSGQIYATPFVGSGSHPGPASGIPATNADRNTSSGINCNEKDGNTCQQYGNDWGWCNYPQYKCMTKYMHDVTDKEYTNIESQDEPHATGFVFTHWVDNNSTVEQDATIEYDESTTATASLTLSNTVSTGIEISIEASVPLVLSATIKDTIKMSSTSTSSNSVSKQQTWKVSQGVRVPAKSTIKAQLIIRKVIVSGDWTGQISFPDYAKLWCNNMVGAHREWFVPAGNFVSDSEYGYPTLCDGDTCTVTAKFNGWHGVDSETTITECKLFSRDCESAEPIIV